MIIPPYNRKILFGILFVLSSMILFLFLLYEKKEGPRLDTQGLKQIRIFNSDFKYFKYILEGKDLDDIANKQFPYTKPGTLNYMPTHDYYIIDFVYDNNLTKTIYYYGLLNIFYDRFGTRIKISEKLIRPLKENILSVDQKINNKYGLLIPWDEVKKLFPLMSYATVVDFDTGKSFMVQRRAGTYHADVQPLTAKDTSVMKEIYGGKWSWDRRAIIVKVKNYRIAASMNGMPHGHGKIRDNNFNGHFCIHFLNSITHSGNMDQRHHIQILKAAGILPSNEDSGNSQYTICSE